MEAIKINPKKKKFYRPIASVRMDEFVRNTTASTIPQSTRRVFFTFAEKSIAERGFYKVDQLGGMGSGTLLYFRGKYFLLTAYHVVSAVLSDMQNESPFFLMARDGEQGPRDFDMLHLLFPRWHWDIRTLMPESHGDTAWNDVALIELFDPYCAIPESQIINLDKVQIITRKEFFEGQHLVGSGFPAERNYFEYGEEGDFLPGSSQQTRIQRHHSSGHLVRGDGLNDFYFRTADRRVSHAEMNGMSGGSLVNIYPHARKTKWAGMLKAVDESRGLVQFIPAYALIGVLRRYAESNRLDLDPNAGAPFVGISPKKREEVQEFMRYMASLR